MAELNPKVSIVIPVYNGSNFLSEAVESALAQTYPNIEVVIVNDGSTDGGKTEKIALGYGERVKYYYKSNGGVASALNFGIKRMTGEYFSWLSHDDLYERTKIEEEINLLLTQHAPNTTIVACNSFALFDNGIKKKEKIARAIFDNFFDIFLGASAKVGLNGCSLLIPRKVLIESGGFNVDLPVTQDYDLWARLKDTCRFVLLDKYLVVYRHHDMQDSVLKAEKSRVAGDELRARILDGVSRKHFGRFLDSNKQNEKWIWENYRTYKFRGHIKTSLKILALLAYAYGATHSKKAAKVLSEVSAYEVMYKISSSRTEVDGRRAVARIEKLNKLVESGVRPALNSQKNLSKMEGYAESIRNDGVSFFVHKALRKLVRILRRSS